MSENTVSDQSKQRFGQYIAQEILVTTNVYAVYTSQTPAKETVFIELLLLDDDLLIEQFEQRVSLLKELEHPAVAPIIDHGVDQNGLPFVIYGPSKGTPLSNLLHTEGTPFAELDSLIIGQQLANALHSVKIHDIYHLDLRPENIILTGHNDVALIGLATPHTAQIANRPFSKKYLDFASPEQIDDKPLEPQSNMFSIGVILYNLLAGHPPKYRVTNWDIFSQGDDITFDALNNVNKELNPRTYQLVRRCLGRKTWSRFEQIEDLSKAVNSTIRAITHKNPERSKSANAVKLPLPVKLAKPAKLPQDKRMLYGGIALIIALIIIGSLAIYRANQNRALINNSEEGEAGFFSLEPTPSPTKTLRPATRTPIPIEATLLQPPNGAEFTSQDELTFAWSWPKSLAETERFVLIVKFGNQIVYQTEVDEPAGNQRYQHRTNLLAVAENSGEYSWQVLLQGQNGVTKYTAPSGVFSVLVNTPTPTLTPTNKATQTPTLTATATETAEPTHTPTATACVSLQPPGWVIYRFQAGDTLFNLAIQTGTTVERIEEASCVSASSLRIGTPIFLPRLPVQPTNTPEPPGDDGGGGSGDGGSSGSSGSSGGNNPPPPPPITPTPTPPPLP